MDMWPQMIIRPIVYPNTLKIIQELLGDRGKDDAITFDNYKPEKY